MLFRSFAGRGSFPATVARRALPARVFTGEPGDRRKPIKSKANIRDEIALGTLDVSRYPSLALSWFICRIMVRGAQDQTGVEQPDAADGAGASVGAPPLI